MIDLIGDKYRHNCYCVVKSKFVVESGVIEDTDKCFG